MTTRTLPAALLGILITSAWGQSPLDSLSPDDIADGERLFRIHCARCHGIDGAGGEGSNLARARLKHASTDEALIKVLDEGIPGTGMPAIRFLDDDQVARVAGYVRSLGRLEDTPMPGDPERGAVIYRTTGGCPACHIVDGQGTGIGPELTYIGDQRGLAYLRDSLTAPSEAQPRTRGFNDYLTVRITTEEGRVEGLRVNEDAFTIQVRDINGRVHSYRKDQLLELDKAFSHSLMPEYGAVLSGRDLDDVVSYLMSLGSPE